MRTLTPEAAAALCRAPGAKRRYQWDDWFCLAASGTPVLLVRGDDFPCTPRSMVQQAYAAGAVAAGVIATKTTTESGAEVVLLRARDGQSIRSSECDSGASPPNQPDGGA